MFKRILQALIILIAIFLGMELMTRAVLVHVSPFFGNENPPSRVEHRLLNHTRIPNSTTRFISANGEFNTKIRFNNVRLREENIPVLKPKGVHRTLFLGASFLAALQVEDDKTFPVLLEKSLGDKNDVLNSGIGGVSPIIEYLYYKNYGVSFESDLVIMMLARRHILTDHNFKSSYEFNSEGLPIRLIRTSSKSSFIPIPVKMFMKKNFLFVNILRRLKSTGPAYVFLDEYIGNSNKDQFAYFRDGLGTHKEFEGAFKETFRYITAIKKVADHRKSQFLLVYLPAGNQINPKEWENIKKVYHLSDQSHPDSPQRLIKTVTDKENIRFLDLTPVMTEKSKGDLFYPHDGHLSPKGHQVVSDAIGKYLKENPELLELKAGAGVKPK